MNSKGQIAGVGGLIALLVMIAIGALVTYEVTGMTRDSVDVDTLTVENENSGSVTVNHGVDTATTKVTYSVSIAAPGTMTLAVTLNGENIVETTLSSTATTGTIENTTAQIAPKILMGTNTLSVDVDNRDAVLALTTVLDIDTYSETTVGNVEARGSTVFNLLTILCIVFVAALIIGVVIRALGGGAIRAGGVSPAL